MRIHMYTNAAGLSKHRHKVNYFGWSKDSSERPDNAVHHIDVDSRQVNESEAYKGVYYVYFEGVPHGI